MPSRVAKKIKQLTLSEQQRIRDVLAKKGTATQALAKINESRRKNGSRLVEKSCVHRFVRGDTHQLGAGDTRGRKNALSKRDIRKLDTTRRRLIKKAKNQYRVTYQDVLDAADLEDPPCLRVVEDALRDEGVGFKAPRHKIYVTEDDAVTRFEVAKRWSKRRKSYWSQEAVLTIRRI